MPAPPDRALRLLVAELAEVSDEDRDAILDSLDPIQRSAVTDLLAEFEPLPAASSPVGPVLPAGLSPWLAARLERACEGGPADDLFSLHPGQAFSMTESAARALRAAAEPLCPAMPVRASAEPVSPSRTGWFTRMESSLFGRRAGS